jgi:hypothetical protein
MLAVRFGADQAHSGKPLKMRPSSDSCAEPKIFSSISILLAAGLLAAAGLASAAAQAAEPAAGNPVAQSRCTTVALTSDSDKLPLRLIEPYLQQRADFQASKLVLTDEQASADAIVTLTPSGERDTHIVVASRVTGRHISALSLWTDYPGMIASDVMEKVKMVCVEPAPALSQQAGSGQHGAESVAARASHERGFRHVVGRVGFYAGQAIGDAALVAGYAALGIGMAAGQ